MDYVTIAIIVFFLIFMIIGYIKGFLGIVLNLFRGLASIVISYFLCKPFGDFLFKLGLGNFFAGKLEGSITKMTAAAGEIITSENFSEVVRNALTEMKIPDFLHSIIVDIVGKIDLTTQTETLGFCVANALATIACTVIAFLVLTVTLNIIVFLLSKVLKRINRVPLIGKVNRLLGLVTNALYAWLLISICFWIVALISTFIPEVGNFVNSVLKLDQETMSFAKWLYEHNLATIIYNFFVK